MKIERQQIEQQFSTFLVILNNSHTSWRWQQEPRLKNNIIKIIQNLDPPKNNQDYLAKQLLANLREAPNFNIFHQRHLMAYLQEPCYWATNKVYKSFSNYTPSLKWEDYFQWGNLLIAEPLKLLKKYQTNLGGKITHYAQRRLEDYIADSAYAHNQWDRASDWGLLRKISQRRRKELLTLLGISQHKINQYLLVWQCFNEIFTNLKEKKQRQLSAPTEQQFSKMVDLYQQSAPNITEITHSITVEELKSIIQTCIKTARKFNNPSVVSQPEYFDVADETNNLLANLEAQEDEEKLSIFTQVLNQGVASLDCKLELILKLWKGLQLTQQQIVEVMGINYPGFVTQQYQVARKFEKVRQDLLSKLAQQYPSVSKLTPETIADLKAGLDSYLETHYTDTFYNALSEVYQQHQSEVNLKLKLAQAIASLLDLPQPHSLDSHLNTYIDAWLNQQKG